MKKILKRDGVFGRGFMEFYSHEGERVMWIDEDPPWESNYYDCGCRKCCGCMCWVEGEDEE